MKILYKIYLAAGATAAIGSFAMLLAISKYISSTLDEDDEEVPEEVKKPKSGLVDVPVGMQDVKS